MEYRVLNINLHLVYPKMDMPADRMPSIYYSFDYEDDPGSGVGSLGNSRDKDQKIVDNLYSEFKRYIGKNKIKIGDKVEDLFTSKIRPSRFDSIIDLLREEHPDFIFDLVR